MFVAEKKKITMENTEQKTPEQWFQQLKEPYRSEVIKNITYSDYNAKSLYDALYRCVACKCKDLETIMNSVKAGQTTYLETELKPQDMISGEWYVIDCGIGKWLEKFKELVGNRIYSYHSFDLDCCEYSKSGLHIGYGEGDKIRKATREEVLEHFPDEFQQEKKIPYSIYQPLFDLMCEQHNARLIDSEMQEIINVCENILESRKEENKQVESELKDGEMYFYFIDGSFSATTELEYAIDNTINGSYIYRATPIGTKQTKSFLEPIKTK
jgi:hypothetical protein